MAELISLVQTYIGPLQTPKHLNYYSALGLDELTEDRQAIGLAIENAIEKLKRADRTKDPKGFEEVVKVVRSARSTLLDGEKKATYDTQLKAILRKTAPSVLGEDSQLLTESARLKELLPIGDPSAPFSLTDFLKSRPDDVVYETVAQRQDALRPLLAAINSETTTTTISESGSTNTLSGFAQVRPAINSNRAASSPARALQEELRRKRRQSNLIAAGFAIGIACILLGGGLWMYLSNQAEQLALANQRAANQNANQAQATSIDSESSELNSLPSNTVAIKSNAEKKRMNLGISSDPNSSANKSATPMRLPGIGETEHQNESPNASEEANEKSSSIQGGMSDPLKPMDETMKKSSQKPSEKISPNPKEKMSGTTMPDSDDAAAWSAAMSQAMQAVRSRNFDLFGTEIDTALASSEDPTKQKQAEKLNLIGQLVQMSDQAFQDGYKGLRSTNTIAFTETSQAIIVEVTPELLVARVKGNNERMSVDKMPIEWVLAIANLELGNKAIDDAVRGTILQWDLRATNESKKGAKKFFDAAASKDPKFSMLDSVYSSEYK